MPDDYREYAALAERAAREAGALLLAASGRVEAREKAPGDLVTDADSASQRAIAATLLGAHPDHTLLGEEDGAVPDPDCAWRWIVDPLDGTVNFAHGLPIWCVSIGLEHRGRLVAGVVHVPPTGATFSASLGAGATLDGRPIRVSGADTLRSALIGAAMPVDFARDADRQLALMGRFSTGTHSVRRTGSTAWNLALVAAGGLDLCYATSVHPWDVAAGVVLVREAGGTVTDLAGAPHDPYAGGLLATNGRLHAEAVRAIAEAWPVPAP